MLRRRRVTFALALALAACGSRTALLVTTSPDDAGDEGGADASDAGHDVAIERDASDVLPPIDVSRPDVPLPNDCPDAASTLIYVISSTNVLMSFFPPTLGFKTIGTISCPNTNGTPYSMGVDRKGAAYVVFTDQQLFKVSTLTAACVATTFAPNPMSGFAEFGMGFAGDVNGDVLYVAGAGTPSAGLATIDTKTYDFTFVGKFSPNLNRTELTGTGDGRLFGWSPDPNTSGSTLTQIDRSTAQLIGANKLKVGTPQDAFAFAFWGGDFYIFAGQSATTVTKYDPVALTETAVTSTSALVVGAGVSTCAPQQ